MLRTLCLSAAVLIVSLVRVRCRFWTFFLPVVVLIVSLVRASCWFRALFLSVVVSYRRLALCVGFGSCVRRRLPLPVSLVRVRDPALLPRHLFPP